MRRYITPSSWMSYALIANQLGGNTVLVADDFRGGEPVSCRRPTLHTLRVSLIVNAAWRGVTPHTAHAAHRFFTPLAPSHRHPPCRPL